jgi:hypothetical protein
MPFGLAHMPSLGLSLLKAELAEVGIEADVHYLFLEFANDLGYDFYQKVSQGSASSLGDWIFYPSLWGGPSDKARDIFWSSQFRDGSSRDLEQTFEALQNRVESAQQIASDFIESCGRRFDGSSRAIVGFTTMFQQNIASLALAR